MNMPKKRTGLLGLYQTVPRITATIMLEMMRPQTYIELRIVRFHWRLRIVPASESSERACFVPYCAFAKGDASSSGGAAVSAALAASCLKSALDSQACASSVVVSGGVLSECAAAAAIAASEPGSGVTGPGVTGETAPSSGIGDVGMSSSCGSGRPVGDASLKPLSRRGVLACLLEAPEARAAAAAALALRCAP